jgi:hypothetical protein
MELTDEPTLELADDLSLTKRIALGIKLKRAVFGDRDGQHFADRDKLGRSLGEPVRGVDYSPATYCPNEDTLGFTVVDCDDSGHRQFNRRLV